MKTELHQWLRCLTLCAVLLYGARVIDHRLNDAQTDARDLMQGMVNEQDAIRAQLEIIGVHFRG